MRLAAGKTVLFIGDSITHAHRMPLEIHDCFQLGSGYVNSVAAELTAATPDAGWRFVNRGECGDTVRHLAGRWDADCLAAAPAIVSVLIGINDAGSAEVQVAEFADAFAALLERTRRVLPEVRLIVLEPFGLAVKPDRTLEVISAGQLERLAALQPMVADVAAGAGAVFVRLQSLFERAAAAAPAEAWTRDGIHPSAAGHWLIARAWVAAAREAGWFPILDPAPSLQQEKQR